MISRLHELSDAQYYEALQLNRTSVDREGVPIRQSELVRMNLIRSRHMDDPAWGCGKVPEHPKAF